MKMTHKVLQKHLLVIVLLLVQCMFMFYWGTQKGGYYVDEFFTYDNANYLSATTPKRVKLYDMEDLKREEWINMKDVKSTLTIEREDALINDSISHNVKAFFSRPYMAILSYVEAVFFEGELNWWSAISLNIVIFLINQIFLYKIALRLCGKQNLSLIVVALYGFCGMAISMLVYVRMYMWLTMLTTMFTYLHLLMWEEEKHWKNICYEGIAFLLIYIAFKNSPLPLLYFAPMIVCFAIFKIIKKNYKQAAYYAIPIIVVGVWYMSTQTNYLKFFSDIETTIQTRPDSDPIASLLSSFMSLSIYNVGGRIVDFLHIVCRFFFGHVVAVIVFLLMFLALIIYAGKNGQLKEIKGKFGKIDYGFFVVIAVCVSVYAIASVCFELTLIRYNCFIFPQIALICVLLVFPILQNRISEGIAITGFVVTLLAGLFYTCTIPRIENLYQDEKHQLEIIAQYDTVDSLVVDYGFDDRVMYECIAYAGEETKIMFTQYENTEYVNMDDTVLVWQNCNKTFSIEEELRENGYESIEKIAQTHESIVFLCRKRI